LRKLRTNESALSCPFAPLYFFGKPLIKRAYGQQKAAGTAQGAAQLFYSCPRTIPTAERRLFSASRRTWHGRAAMGTAQDTAKSEKSDFFHLSSLQYEKNRV